MPDPTHPMPAPLTPTRDQALQRTRRALQRDSFPRLQMTLMVALTGGAGLLASFALLHLGVHAMALRWPLALGLAYLCFLGLLGLWLRWQAGDRPDLSTLADLAPGPGRTSAPGGSGARPAPMRSGGGGDFGGGGASGGFETPVLPPGTAQAAQTAQAGTAAAPWGGASMDAATQGGGLELPDVDLGDVEDGPGLLALLLVALVALAMALASLWVVWTAPALLSEVLVDGALSFTLYRHLRRTEPRHWLTAALRHTWLPLAATALCLAAAGGVLASVAPGARSLGEVLGQPTPPR